MNSSTHITRTFRQSCSDEKIRTLMRKKATSSVFPSVDKQGKAQILLQTNPRKTTKKSFNRYCCHRKSRSWVISVIFEISTKARFEHLKRVIKALSVIALEMNLWLLEAFAVEAWWNRVEKFTCCPEQSTSTSLVLRGNWETEITKAQRRFVMVDAASDPANQAHALSLRPGHTND